MALIVSDASPIHYLALIGKTDLLLALFGHLAIPQEVFDELQKPGTPDDVKAFAISRPVWLEVRAISTPIDASLTHLDQGEQEAITLALESQATALLIDETKGRRAATRHGLKVVGTLGVLLDAALNGLGDLEGDINKLRQTNFHATEALYQRFLDLYEENKKA